MDKIPNWQIINLLKFIKERFKNGDNKNDVDLSLYYKNNFSIIENLGYIKESMVFQPTNFSEEIIPIYDITTNGETFLNEQNKKYKIFQNYIEKHNLFFIFITTALTTLFGLISLILQIFGK